MKHLGFLLIGSLAGCLSCSDGGKGTVDTTPVDPSPPLNEQQPPLSSTAPPLNPQAPPGGGSVSVAEFYLIVARALCAQATTCGPTTTGPAGDAGSPVVSASTYWAAACQLYMGRATSLSSDSGWLPVSKAELESCTSQYFARVGCAMETELQVEDIPGCAGVAGIVVPYVDQGEVNDVSVDAGAR
jgi:hypothetical protein